MHQNTWRKYFGADFFNKLIQGMIIGVAGIVPGLSGGAIAAATGLYEPAIHAVVNLKKDFFTNAKYLLPLAVGGAAGFLLFSRLLDKVMATEGQLVIYIFLGFVIGSLPSLIKEANSKGFDKKYIVPLVLAFLAIIGIGLIPVVNAEVSPGNSAKTLHLFLSGSILAVGTIIPGIVASFILMHLGWYGGMISAIANLEIANILLIGAGFAVTALLILKLADYIFRKFRGYAYYGVIGFLLASMVIVFPGFRTGWKLVLDIVCLLASVAVSYALMNLKSLRFFGKK